MKLSPIVTRRLILRPLEAGDAEELQNLTNDPAIISGISFLTWPFTIEKAVSLIEMNSGVDECFLGVRRAAEGNLLGVAGIHLQGLERIEIGYWIGTAFHGQGYASEAAEAVIAAVRQDFPMRQIIAECRPENLASWRILEKLGFQATGMEGARQGRKLLILEKPD